MTVTAAAPEPGQTQSQEPTGVPGDGVSLVGTDITPGTYRATGDRCYWARLSGTSGEFSDIIANSNGPGVVTIAATDKAFESRRCEWSKV